MAVIHHSSSPKSLPKRLKLPVKHPAIATRTRGNATRITSLPHELLDRIYSHLKHARSQIAFSLSCRTFAYIAYTSPTTLKTGFIVRHGYPAIYDKEHLLSDLLRWNFIPPKLNLQLCTSCWKYLPRQRIWYTRSGRRLTTLKKVDWNYAVMLWMHGRNGTGRALTCPTCQIPDGYDDEKPGQFLQAWDSGFAGGILRVQSYEPMEKLKSLNSGTVNKRGLVQISPAPQNSEPGQLIQHATPSPDVTKRKTGPRKRPMAVRTPTSPRETASLTSIVCEM